jgi:hypothetical protein
MKQNWELTLRIEGATRSWMEFVLSIILRLLSGATVSGGFAEVSDEPLTQSE